MCIIDKRYLPLWCKPADEVPSPVIKLDVTFNDVGPSSLSANGLRWTNPPKAPTSRAFERKPP